MRIGIDAHYLGQRQSGNESYVRNIISCFAEIAPDNEYIIYVINKFANGDVPVESSCVKYVSVARSPLLRVSINFPYRLLREPVDILHVHYNAPLYVPSSLVVVMHDISWALYPEMFPYLKGRQILWRSYSAVKKAARVVVGTQAIKEEVIDFYKLPEEKVVVIPLGIDEKAFVPVTKEEAKKRLSLSYNIDYEYLLYVGDMQPRKNLPRLIEALSILKSQGIKEKLVIVGKKAWLYEDIFARIKELRLENDVVFAGYVDDSELPYFYGGAKLFIYPSLYEGFGLPPLEAMACGVPTAVSANPVFAETVGDAVAVFDALDAASISETIKSVLDDEDRQDQLRKAGLERAKRFQWRTTSRMLLDIYKEVYENE